MENIFLIGFMGAGKSYLGKKLAQQLNRKFIDTDTILEEQENLSIEEIFKQKGEDYFRTLERKLLQSLEEGNGWVIATGGGLPCEGDNMKLLNQKGKSIFLCANASLLYKRLKKDAKPRPLLDKKNPDERMAFIEEKLLERTPFYNKAHHIFFLTDHEPNNLHHFLQLDFS